MSPFLPYLTGLQTQVPPDCPWLPLRPHLPIAHLSQAPATHKRPGMLWSQGLRKYCILGLEFLPQIQPLSPLPKFPLFSFTSPY